MTKFNHLRGLTVLASHFVNGCSRSCLNTSISIATTLVFAALGGASVINAGEIAFPGAEWQTKKPPELGLDEARLDAIARSLGSRGCAIKNGYVVKTWGAQDKKGDLF